MPFDLRTRLAEPRLEMKLWASDGSFAFQPYHWRAFEVVTDTNVIRPIPSGTTRFRPGSSNSPRLRKVRLTRSPLLLDINLTNYYTFRLRSDVKQGDPVVLVFRCVSSGHYSRMIFVKAKFE